MAKNGGKNGGATQLPPASNSTHPGPPLALSHPLIFRFEETNWLAAPNSVHAVSSTPNNRKSALRARDSHTRRTAIRMPSSCTTPTCQRHGALST